MEPKPIKIIFQDEIRRVNLQDKEFTYEEVKGLTKNLFTSVKEPFHFRYQDEEGDIVTIASNDDFIEALRVTKATGVNLKIGVVEVKKENPATNGVPHCGINWNQHAEKRRGCHWGRRFKQNGGGCFVSRALPIVLRIIVAIFFIKLLVCVVSGRACILPVIMLGTTLFFFGKKIKGRFFGRNCQIFNGQCPLSRWCQEQSTDRQVPETEVVREEKKEEQQVKQEVPIQQQQQVEQEKEEEEEESKVVVQGNKREGSSFSRSLKQLEDMGFLDRDRNIAVLVQNRGNVVNAVRDLLA